MVLLEQLVPQVRSSSDSKSRVHDETSLLSSYMPLNDSKYDSSCETCNNCGSGNCASCCGSSD